MDLKTIFNKNTYLISDQHFGHSKITEFEPSRLTETEKDSQQSQEDMIIQRHNSIVKEDDIVVFLGDFAFNSPSNWASKLNGKKYLILGNHDRPNHQSYERDFEHVFRGVYYDIDGINFVHKPEDELVSSVIVECEDYVLAFCHYPIGYEDEHDFRRIELKNRIKLLSKIHDSFMIDYVIHGHVHSKSVPKDMYYNVSCEAINFTPVKLGELICF